MVETMDRTKTMRPPTPPTTRPSSDKPSQLVLWPRRRSPHRQGFVLGWSYYCNRHDNNKNASSCCEENLLQEVQSRPQRQVLVCAGILPIVENIELENDDSAAGTMNMEKYKSQLEVYRRRLQDYVKTQQQLQPVEANCHCWIPHLDIVAFWSRHGSCPEDAQNDQGDDGSKGMFLSLPIVREYASGTYIWYCKNNKQDPKSTTTTTSHPHAQLVWYDPHALFSPFGQSLDTLLEVQLFWAPRIVQFVSSLEGRSGGGGGGEHPHHSVVGTMSRQQKEDSPTTPAPWLLRLAHYSIFAVHLCANQSQGTPCWVWQRCWGTQNKVVSETNDSCGFATPTITCTLCGAQPRTKATGEAATKDCHGVYALHKNPQAHASHASQDAYNIWLDVIMGWFLALLMIVTWWLFSSKSGSSDFAVEGSRSVSGWELVTHWFVLALDWLEDAPVGFKLNIPLTTQMGRFLRQLLQTSIPVLVVFPRFGTVALGVTLCTMGWTASLALCMDLWRIQLLAISLLASIFSKLFQAERFMLGALFRLFRGSKHNPLRQRTDTMQYDATQLLVGTIGLCIGVFGFTTILVYHIFFGVVWNLMVGLPLVLLWMAYSALCSVPLGWVVARWRHPEWFPGKMHLEFRKDQYPIRVATWRSAPESLGTMVLSSRIFPVWTPVWRWWAQGGLSFLLKSTTFDSSERSLVSVIMQKILLQEE